MDDKQLFAFLTMADLSDQEKRIAQQQAQANQLRNAAMTGKGGGVGGGLARGIQGGMAEYQQRQVNQKMDEYSKAKQRTLDDIRKSLMGNQQNLPIAPPQQPIDYSQYGDYF